MRRNLNWAISLAVVFLSADISFAEIHPLAGTTALSFLKIGAGARMAAMAEAGIAIVDDATACYWNPARLSQMEQKHSVYFLHSAWIAETTIDEAYYAAKIGKHRVGIGGRLLSAGDIPLREDAPSLEPIDYYNAYDFFAGLSYAFVPSTFLSFGASYRRIYEKIYLNSGYGHSLQAGLNFNFFDGDLTLAGTADNIGPRVQMEHFLFKQPTTFKIGSSWRIPWTMFDGRWLASIDMVKPIDNHWQIRSGSEYLWKGQLALRMGYKIGHDSETYAVGLGYLWRSYDLDYAFVPNSYDLGNSHRFSLGIGF